MAHGVSFKPVLDNELLLDSGFPAPARKVSVFVGKRSGKLHAFKDVLIKGFPYGVEGVDSALGVEGMFDLVLIFLGKRESLTTMPLERRNFDFSDKTKKLEHKSSKRDSTQTLTNVRTDSSPSVVFGGFGEKGEKDSPDFKGKGVGGDERRHFPRLRFLSIALKSSLASSTTCWSNLRGQVLRQKTSAEGWEVCSFVWSRESYGRWGYR